MSAIKNIESAIRRVESLAVSRMGAGPEDSYRSTVIRYSVVQKKEITANGHGSSALTALIDAFEVLDQQDRASAAKQRERNEKP